MESNSDLSILQKVLGHAFFRMPTILRTIYGPQATVSLVGDVQVDYGKNIFAYLASYFIKMPKSGSYTLMLSVDKELQNEFWTRNFPTQSMRSEVHYQKGTVMEKYRFFRFLMHVKISDRTLIFNLKRSFLFFMPLPRLLSVRPSFVVVAQDKKHCHLEAEMHFLGFFLASYSGVLQLQ